MNTSKLEDDLRSLNDEFEALDEADDDSDPLGIILAYDGGGGGGYACW